MRCLFVTFAVLLGLSLTATAQLTVQPDPDNTVAAGLVGTWTPDAGLTERIAGQLVASGEVRFTAYPDIVRNLPLQYQELLANRRIYLGGIMTRDGETCPFVLTEFWGGPCIIYFRAKDGKPLADAESFKLTLVPGRNGKQDLLFLCGIHKGDPYTAFTRSR